MSALATDTATPTGTHSSWQHKPALDGLRAAAVIAVLLFHAGHLQGGFLGVDLFFALSGFLITSLLIRDADGPGIRLTAFWGRRLRRLLPAAFALIAAVAVWAWAFGTPAELAGVRRDGPWAIAYVANWHAIAESTGYWASFSQPSMFDHLWSLAIEEQFYLLWPVLVAAVWTWSRRPARALTLLCAAGIVASFATMVAVYRGGDPTRVYMGTDTRAASLLAGALAATPAARRLVAAAVGRLARRIDALLVLVTAVILSTWLAIDGASSTALYSGGLLLHSLGCALLVAVVASAGHTRFTRTLAWRPMVWVGALSYSLYLWHWPVYVVLSAERTGLDGVVLTSVRVAVSTGFAVVSYRLIENPIRHRAQWVRGPFAVPALAGSIAAVVFVLAVLPTPPREIAAFDPSTIDDAAAAEPELDVEAEPVAGFVATATVPTTTATSTPAPRTTPAAPVAAERSPRTVVETTVVERAVVDTIDEVTTSDAVSAESLAPFPPIAGVIWAGDSIAYDLAPAVHAALTAAGLDVDVTAAYPGFRISNSDDETSLSSFVVQLLDAQLGDVVVAQLSVWDAPLEPDVQRESLARFQDLVLERGARVVYVGAPNTSDPAGNAGLVTLSDAARQLGAADPERVLFLDPTALWGAEAVIDLDADGTPERKRDRVHVCPSGAARFAVWLGTELAGRFAGVTPAPASDWAVGAWVTDGRYDEPVGSCAPLG